MSERDVTKEKAEPVGNAVSRQRRLPVAGTRRLRTPRAVAAATGSADASPQAAHTTGAAGGVLDQAAGCLVGNRRELLVGTLLEEYLGLHREAVAAVKSECFEPLQRVDALSRLSQALDRTLRALGKASPELSRLAVAKWVLERQADFVRQHFPERLELLVEILEPFGEELVQEMGRR